MQISSLTQICQVLHICSKHAGEALSTTSGFLLSSSEMQQIASVQQVCQVLHHRLQGSTIYTKWISFLIIWNVDCITAASMPSGCSIKLQASKVWHKHHIKWG
jgi:hypothetical protein